MAAKTYRAKRKAWVNNQVVEPGQTATFDCAGTVNPATWELVKGNPAEKQREPGRPVHSEPNLLPNI